MSSDQNADQAEVAPDREGGVFVTVVVGAAVLSFLGVTTCALLAIWNGSAAERMSRETTADVTPTGPVATARSPQASQAPAAGCADCYLPGTCGDYCLLAAGRRWRLTPRHLVSAPGALPQAVPGLVGGNATVCVRGGASQPWACSKSVPTSARTSLEMFLTRGEASSASVVVSTEVLTRTGLDVRVQREGKHVQATGLKHPKGIIGRRALYEKGLKFGGDSVVSSILFDIEPVP
jgi:hypothetical protein